MPEILLCHKLPNSLPLVECVFLKSFWGCILLQWVHFIIPLKVRKGTQPATSVQKNSRFNMLMYLPKTRLQKSLVLIVIKWLGNDKLRM